MKKSEKLPRMMVEIHQGRVWQVWSDIPVKCLVRNLDTAVIRKFEIIDSNDNNGFKKELDQMEEIADLVGEEINNRKTEKKLQQH